MKGRPTEYAIDNAHLYCYHPLCCAWLQQNGFLDTEVSGAVMVILMLLHITKPILSFELNCSESLLLILPNSAWLLDRPLSEFDCFYLLVGNRPKGLWYRVMEPFGEVLGTVLAPINCISSINPMNPDPPQHQSLNFIWKPHVHRQNSPLLFLYFGSLFLVVWWMLSLRGWLLSYRRSNILLQRTHRALLMGNECAQRYRCLLLGICC